MLLALLVAALAVAGCGDDDDDDGGGGGGAETSEQPSSQIQANDKNSSTKLIIGSKNFTEQKVLGEIYAQALAAAGYDVSTELNLGDEKTALKALEGTTSALIRSTPAPRSCRSSATPPTSSRATRPRRSTSPRTASPRRT